MVRQMKFAANVLMLVALASGCATQGEKMVESYAHTRDTLADSHAQVDQTMRALAALRSSNAQTIQSAFREYRDQVGKLEQQERDAKARAAAMKEEADAHIRAWEKEQAEIHDPQIKATLESRQQAVRSNFSLLQMYADDVRKRYPAFLKRNKDLVQALSIDLSPQAVSSLSKTINDVISDGAALNERITAMQRGLANIAEGKSAIAQ